MPDLLTRAAAALVVLTGLASFPSPGARGGNHQLVTAVMVAAMFLAIAPAANVPVWLVGNESAVLVLLLAAGWALLQRARVQARWNAAFAGEP